MICILKNIIDKFNSISLKDMESVSLLNRIDTKFVFHKDNLPILLEHLKNDYKILSVNSNKIFHYKTLYFDTADFLTYHLHQRGKAGRFKFRKRQYIESGLFFFEVKFKNNKKRTIKKRIKINNFSTCLNKYEKEFIKKIDKIFLNPDYLIPVLYNSFNRITLVNVKNKERLTIDMNLEFQSFKGKNLKSSNLIIAELKRDKYLKNNLFIKIAKNIKIRPSSISKYCLGVSLLFPNIKKNMMKSKIMYLRKINNYDNPFIYTS